MTSDEGHGSLNDGSLCVSELRLDEDLGSSMGSMQRGEIWRREKCSHVNCLKIQLRGESAVCPVVKVLNEPHRTRHGKQENYSRPITTIEAITTDIAM